MIIETLIFNNGAALNRVFTIGAFPIPRFGSTSDALRFDTPEEAEVVLASLPLNIRQESSLQSFVKQ